jgi:hypothetical protein
MKRETELAWMCVYLWTCLEYVHDHYPQAWDECGAEQHGEDYRALTADLPERQE